MTTVVLAFAVGTAVLLAWGVVAALLWSTERSLQSVAAPSRPPAPTPRLTMDILFVSAADDVVVVDGLLDLDHAGRGVPMTWKLELPAHPAARQAILFTLERWAADDDEVDVGVSRLQSVHPSLELARDDTRMRLEVMGPSPLFGGGGIRRT